MEESESWNPSPNNPWFLRVCRTSLLNTLWEKEKLLITSNFSFSHSDLYLFEELIAIFIKFEIVVCKLFQFWKVYICFLAKGYLVKRLLYQGQSYRLIHIERIWRQQWSFQGNSYNPFPNKLWFLGVCSTGLLKTLWEKEKLPGKCFSILLGNFPAFSSNLKLSSANSFSLEESKICCLGKG